NDQGRELPDAAADRHWPQQTPPAARVEPSWTGNNRTIGCGSKLAETGSLCQHLSSTKLHGRLRPQLPHPPAHHTLLPRCRQVQLVALQLIQQCFVVSASQQTCLSSAYSAIGIVQHDVHKNSFCPTSRGRHQR